MARLIDFKDSKLFMQGKDWSELLAPNALHDVTAYKSLRYHLGDIVTFNDYQMNADSEYVLFNPEWKNISIANLEVIDTYIGTSHFIGTIPVLYDGQVETSMMPKVVDETSLFTPYYLLAHMNKQLSSESMVEQMPFVKPKKFSRKVKLMLVRKLNEK